MAEQELKRQMDARAQFAQVRQSREQASMPPVHIQYNSDPYNVPKT